MQDACMPRQALRPLGCRHAAPAPLCPMVRARRVGRSHRPFTPLQHPLRPRWLGTATPSDSSTPESSPSTPAVAAAEPLPSQAEGPSDQQPAGGSPEPPSNGKPSTVSTSSNAAETIDTIDRLTASKTPKNSSSSSSSDPSTSEQRQQQHQQQAEQQEAGGPAWWPAFQSHLAGLAAALAAAWSAFVGQLGSFPAWVAAQKLKQLREAADEAPHDPERQAAYLAALNVKYPKEVLARVESKQYASNSGVVVEYLRALVATDRLQEYAGDAKAGSSSSSSSAEAVGPAGVPQDHRSLAQLLQELQQAAAGQVVEEHPGGSVRRPLHVVLQAGAGRALARPAGPLAAIWSLLGFVMLLLGLSFAWLIGNQAMRQVAVGQGSAATSATMASSSSSGGAGSALGSPGLDPKEYKKEELSEKSVKTFKDVKGCDESKAELQEVVEFLKNPTKFTRLGAKLPKGVLLTGPPGTGKTLLAKAVAGEAGVPFFYRAGSEFEELYVGVGSRRMRALFAAAKKKAPCIVFIDEIDAIGGNRKHWENHTRKTLNQLLTEMDGFETNEGVIVMAATNLPETLDPALKRPGRFDRQVAVPLPDVRGRTEMLEYYLHDKPVSTDVDPRLVARQTTGFSGADISNLVNEAAILAAKHNAEQISASLIDSAYDKILMGVERKSAVRSPEALKRTAYHEGGHALVAMSVPGASPIHKATIIPRGHALGMVTQVGREDEFSINRQQMMARILVALGGQVAEELVFGRDEVSSGASDDLRQATDMARYMVMQCGLSDVVGPYYVADERQLSEDLRQQLDTEVRSMLVEARSRVKSILTERLGDLHSLARALLDHETLTSAEVNRVLAGETLASPLANLVRGAGATPQPEASGVAASAAALEDQ